MMLILLVVVMLLAGAYYLYQSSTANKKMPAITPHITIKPVTMVLDSVQHELVHIAGEDILSTKLDLARAYLESGKHASAAKLVKMVAKDGTDAQKNEARQLWNRLIDLSPVKPNVAKQPAG